MMACYLVATGFHRRPARQQPILHAVVQYFQRGLCVTPRAASTCALSHTTIPTRKDFLTHVAKFPVPPLAARSDTCFIAEQTASRPLGSQGSARPTPVLKSKLDYPAAVQDMRDDAERVGRATRREDFQFRVPCLI